MADKTIIHLSDIHVGLRRKDAQWAELIFKKIADSYPGAVVIITGDLTDSAKTSQFQKMRKLLDELAKTNPILAVPGNHDYAWKGNILLPGGWKNWIKYLGSPLGWDSGEVSWMDTGHEPIGVDGLGVWKDDSVVYFGIDSGDPEDKQISARGYISKKLADALADSLDSYQRNTRIAFLHHHPFTDGFFTKLHGSQRLLKALKNRCELLLFGHEHEYGIWWNSHGVPLIVSSHKSTDKMSGDCLTLTIIDIDNPGTDNALFSHRLEIMGI